MIVNVSENYFDRITNNLKQYILTSSFPKDKVVSTLLNEKLY